MGAGGGWSPEPSLISHCPVSYQHLLFLLREVLHQPFPRGVHVQILCPGRLHRQPLPPIPL